MNDQDKPKQGSSEKLPRKPEDTDESGDAKSGVGEDNRQSGHASDERSRRNP